MSFFSISASQQFSLLVFMQVLLVTDADWRCIDVLFIIIFLATSIASQVRFPFLTVVTVHS
jgi:hypothetical protein